MWLLEVARRLGLIYHLRLNRERVLRGVPGGSVVMNPSWSGKIPQAVEQLSLRATTIAPEL